MDWATELLRQRVLFRRWLFRFFILAIWLSILGGTIWLGTKAMGY